MPTRRDVKTRDIARMYRRGMTIVEIGAAVRMDPSGIWYRLARAGVEMRPPGSRQAMRTGRCRDDITAEDVRALYGGGLGIRAVAERLGCSATAIRARLAGVAPIRGRGGRRREDIREDDVRRLRAAGLTLQAIAERLGCSMGAVYSRLRRGSAGGVAPPPDRKPP
jgi:transposase